MVFGLSGKKVEDKLPATVEERVEVYLDLLTEKFSGAEVAGKPSNGLIKFSHISKDRVEGMTEAILTYGLHQEDSSRIEQFAKESSYLFFVDNNDDRQHVQITRILCPVESNEEFASVLPLSVQLAHAYPGVKVYPASKSVFAVVDLFLPDPNMLDQLIMPAIAKIDEVAAEFYRNHSK